MSSFSSVVDDVGGFLEDVQEGAQTVEEAAQVVGGTSRDVAAGVEGAATGAEDAIRERRTRQVLSDTLTHPAVLIGGTAAATLLILQVSGR